MKNNLFMCVKQGKSCQGNAQQATDQPRLFQGLARCYPFGVVRKQMALPDRGRRRGTSACSQKADRHTRHSEQRRRAVRA